MGDNVDINILIIISCICMLFVIGRCLIWIINLIGSAWGFHIGLNLYTSILVRIFRDSWCDFLDYFEIDCTVKYENSAHIEWAELDELIQ